MDDNNYVSVMSSGVFLTVCLSIAAIVTMQRTRSFVARFDHSISFKFFFFSMATEDIN